MYWSDQLDFHWHLKFVEGEGIFVKVGNERLKTEKDELTEGVVKVEVPSKALKVRGKAMSPKYIIMVSEMIHSVITKQLTIIITAYSFFIALIFTLHQLALAPTVVCWTEYVFCSFTVRSQWDIHGHVHFKQQSCSHPWPNEPNRPVCNSNLREKYKQRVVPSSQYLASS